MELTDLYPNRKVTIPKDNYPSTWEECEKKGYDKPYFLIRADYMTDPYNIGILFDWDKKDHNGSVVFLSSNSVYLRDVEPYLEPEFYQIF